MVSTVHSEYSTSTCELHDVFIREMIPFGSLKFEPLANIVTTVSARAHAR